VYPLYTTIPSYADTDIGYKISASSLIASGTSISTAANLGTIVIPYVGTWCFITVCGVSESGTGTSGNIRLGLSTTSATFDTTGSSFYTTMYVVTGVSQPQIAGTYMNQFSATTYYGVIQSPTNWITSTGGSREIFMYAIRIA
jgi:hypothetical protein